MTENTPKIALEKIKECAKANSKELILNCQLTFVPPEISQLTDLEFLDLRGNKLTSLPPEVFQLINLRGIALTGNELSVLPVEIGNLIHLESLLLSQNKLTTLPSKIGNLKKLKVLSIAENAIKNLPEEIGQLNSLEIFYAVNTGLATLPKGIENTSNLKTLYLSNNSLPIPPEILVKTGEPKTIINYYFSVFHPDDGSRNTVKSLNEIKMLVVGQGSVGKTSLIKRLVLEKFNMAEIKTDGIEISRWNIDCRYDQKNKHLIQINIWDFGGQEIMHATHQFFLTKRSLYLLVLDSRLTQEENRVEYWLKIIQSFGGESPVMIVGNKTDQHPLDIDRTGLQKKYPNIVGILEASAAIGTGIDSLKSAITEQVNSLPHVRDLLPETWFAVKTKLEGIGHESNFITHDDYDILCNNSDVRDETSQHTLIGFLHDLGVVLYFQDDPRLEALGILNPQWVTNGVYKILNSHDLFQKKGLLTVSMLDEILNLPEYPRGKRLFIVDMMKKFELCYDIEPDKIFLVPDLLPKDEPSKLKFSGIPVFEYAYPVLPSSVITRFIVRTNQKIDNGLVWRTGVVLKIEENTALVKADIEDRKITIAIDGLKHTRRDALSAIRYQLDEIHGSIKGLEAEKFVPVPGAVKAKPLPYNYLLMLEATGIETLPVPDGDRLVEVNVRQVLSGVESESQRKASTNSVTNYISYVGGNVSGNLVVGDDNQIIQNSYNKIKSAEIAPELKETMKQLAEAVDIMIQKLPVEQAAEVAEDFGKLADEAVKPKPNKKWYSVSIDGLIKGAENLDKLGTPVISLSRKVLSLLTGGVVK